MRKRFIFSIAALIWIATAGSAGAVTCTEWKGRCLHSCGKEGVCAAGWKQCMRTGVWIGAKTGKYYGPGEKQ